MSVSTFSFFDDRRSGCVYKLLKLYEKPPWWGAGIYRVDVPCDHPDVNMKFVSMSVSGKVPVRSSGEERLGVDGGEKRFGADDDIYASWQHFPPGKLLSWQNGLRQMREQGGWCRQRFNSRSETDVAPP